jgi:hypothetical protein
MAIIYPEGVVIQNIDPKTPPRCSICGKEGKPGGYCMHTMEEIKAAYPKFTPFK